MHTSMCKEKWTKLRAVANKTGRPIVGRRTRLHAIIAARAAVKVDQHGLLAIDESFIHQKLDQRSFQVG